MKQSLTDLAAAQKIKINFTNKRLFRVLEGKIGTEPVIAVAEGFAVSTTSKVLLAVTDRFVYLAAFGSMLGGIDTEMIPLSKISGVATRTGGFMSSLIISESSGDHVIERVGKAAALSVEKAIQEQLQ